MHIVLLSISDLVLMSPCHTQTHDAHPRVNLQTMAVVRDESYAFIKMPHQYFIIKQSIVHSSKVVSIPAQQKLPSCSSPRPSILVHRSSVLQGRLIAYSCAMAM